MPTSLSAAFRRLARGKLDLESIERQRDQRVVTHIADQFDDALLAERLDRGSVQCIGLFRDRGLCV
jgi:hypothetical protein